MSTQKLHFEFPVFLFSSATKSLATTVVHLGSSFCNVTNQMNLFMFSAEGLHPVPAAHTGQCAVRLLHRSTQSGHLGLPAATAPHRL